MVLRLVNDIDVILSGLRTHLPISRTNVCSEVALTAASTHDGIAPPKQRPDLRKRRFSGLQGASLAAKSVPRLAKIHAKQDLV